MGIADGQFYSFTNRDNEFAIVDGNAAAIVPTADLYPLTIKNAAVFIEHDGEEIHAERNEIGDLVAKVPRMPEPPSSMEASFVMASIVTPFSPAGI